MQNHIIASCFVMNHWAGRYEFCRFTTYQVACRVRLDGLQQVFYKYHPLNTNCEGLTPSLFYVRVCTALRAAKYRYKIVNQCKIKFKLFRNVNNSTLTMTVRQNIDYVDYVNYPLFNPQSLISRCNRIYDKSNFLCNTI